MPFCSSCLSNHSKYEFSGTQLKKSARVRKCVKSLLPPAEVQRLSEEEFSNEKKRLFAWLQDNGAHFSGVTLKNYNGCRSLHSTKRMKKGDNIMMIPLVCMMRESVSKNTPTGKRLQEIRKITTLSPHTSMALYVLEERAKGKDSFFYPYLSILPKSYDDMPLLFSDNEIDRLKGSLTVPMLFMRNTSIEKEYNSILKLDKELLDGISLKDFKWGRTVIITRVFSCDSTDNGKDREECLVPISDMLNHTHDVGASWNYNRNVGGFVMTCTKNILKNSELYDSYGFKCNSRYFINYGFTLENNECFNQASIFLSEPLNVKEYHVLLKSPDNYDDGYGGYRFNIEHNKNETLVTQDNFYRFQVSTLNPSMLHTSYKTNGVVNVIRAMFSFARISMALPEETDIIKRFNIDEKTIELIKSDPANISEYNRYPLLYIVIPFISLRNEKAALNHISFACSKRLDMYPTTLSEDLLLRDQARMYSTTRNILNMLISEKQVLHYYIDLSNVMKEITSVKSIRKSLKEDSKFSSYCAMFFPGRR